MGAWIALGSLCIPRILIHKAWTGIIICLPQALLEYILGEARNAQVMHTVGQDEVGSFSIHRVHLVDDVSMIDDMTNLPQRSNQYSECLKLQIEHQETQGIWHAVD